MGKKVPPKLTKEVEFYNINLPTDARTKAFEEQVKKFRLVELYIQHLKDLVKEAKKKENNKIQRKIKFYETQQMQRKVISTIFTTLQKNKFRNKLINMLPTDSSWKSWFKYDLWNDVPNIVGIKTMKTQEVATELHKDKNYIPPIITSEELGKFMSFYKVMDFLNQILQKQGNYKCNIFAMFDALDHDVLKEHFVKTKAYSIRNKNDIVKLMKVIVFEHTKEIDDKKDYYYPYHLKYLTISITKPNSMTGASYVELPDFIKNKKALINIKNTDNKCFLYSILCHLIKPKHHAERVSHYTEHMTSLLWKEEEMPMEINKIRFFEKRNNLRINVYGLENKGVVPLFVSQNREITEYPLIQLFYYENHYCYVKDFNRLIATDDNRKMVCPYCCEFSSSGGDGRKAMDKHMSYCISGQKVEMPKEETFIKFKNLSNTISCPIRIYADFETYNDVKLGKKSKNEKTTFKTGHRPASFKTLVVSDIPIDGYKKIKNYYTKSFIYTGKDSDEVFIEKIQELEEELTEIIENEKNKNKETIIMNSEQKIQYDKCQSCWMCENSFTEENHKVRHHNHFTGEYHSPLCNSCNIQVKPKIRIPVLFHNLNYDKNVFFKSICKFKKIKSNKVSILPDNSQNFKSFSIGNLHFIDTIRFMQDSLENLIKNVAPENMTFLKSLANDDNQFSIMRRKGLFPYEWFNDINKFDISIDELKPEDFDNQLNMSKLKCCNYSWENEYKEDKIYNEWDYFKYVVKTLDIKTFRDYHDFYLNIDVNGLADVFENFRKTSLEYYNLDPCYYVGTPSFAWDAMLLKTKVKLEMLTDSDMYQFFERGIRGGQSVIFNKYAKANNKYMLGYDKKDKSVYIIYIDANNLYGEAMSHKLPYKGFKWNNDITVEDVMKYDEEKSDVGYVLEVNLKYPKHLHDKHNDYPLAPERLVIDKSEKLCGTFNDKTDYIVHIKNLKFYLEQGLELVSINRAVEFKQKAWLKEWIDMNTNFRKNAKNDFEKDYFKLMNNSVFGKTMENVRDRIDIKLAFDENYFKKYTTKPNFKENVKYGNDEEFFHLIELSKNSVKLDKPIYAGFSILDLSKLHMYKFHYEVMKPIFGDKIELLATDTDSFFYKIETDDVYNIMYQNKQYFDMSVYGVDSPIYDPTNKKVIGKFSDECEGEIITEFVGIRPKCYSYKLENNDVVKKLKGISKPVVKNTIQFEDYYNCIMGNDVKNEYVCVNAIRTDNMTNYSICQNKKAFSNTDNKRYWIGTKSLAYGHKDIKQQ
jgi:hypothetical protein